MNAAMKQKMSAAWEARNEQALNAWRHISPYPCPFPSDDEKIGFSAGFTACHDLLMPLLVEAMLHVMGNQHYFGQRPDSETAALVQRMKGVIGG